MCRLPMCASCCSPGMDGPEYGGRKDPFDVLLVSKNGMNSDVSTTVFSAYRN